MDGFPGMGEILIRWYHENRRDLPWRETTDPYLIWVSEIILQQTRVAQGLDYYCRFVDRFPDVFSLAEAEEDEVLKYWQGLGYYSRARNLHAAAKAVATRFNGHFPVTYEEVRSLKGVGEYTAAAICSFAYRLPYATVDGNVYRVLARVFGVDTPIDSGEGKACFTALARELMQGHAPDLFNQAMMEFGALQCTPNSPDCGLCPLEGRCLALATNRVDKLPVKREKIAVKPRYFNYLHIHGGGMTLLSKRTRKDIWQHLYEFPLIETDRLLSWDELRTHERFIHLMEGIGEITVTRTVTPPKHVLSHQVIFAQFYDIEVSSFSPAMKAYLMVPEQEVSRYAVSRLMQYFWEVNRES